MTRLLNLIPDIFRAKPAVVIDEFNVDEFIEIATFVQRKMMDNLTRIRVIDKNK